MIEFRNSLIIILILVTSAISAQDYKFGKVSKEELNEKLYAKDSSASAVVLYRSKKIRFDYVSGVGFRVLTVVHERVKIYNKDGFEYATVSEYLYKRGSDRESISGLKAFTYNMEAGKIVKQKMEKSGRFSTDLNKHSNEEKFTLPNIKEGSVIEYEYQVNSPFYWSIDEIVLQYDIPINKQEITIATPEYFVFKPNMKGFLPVRPTFGSKSGKISFTSKNRRTGYSGPTSFNTSAVDYQINTTAYAMNDVPALKEEPFVNDMDNYRSAINYELQYVQFPDSARESYTTSWEEVVKKIYESESFGGQLKSSKYYKEDLEALVTTSSSDTELVATIFLHVQRRMAWNGYKGFSTDKGVKDAYKEKSGNIADINLILTSMLQKAGLNANPVLVSTRDHGVPMFPTMEGFNYVISAVQLEGGTVLLDATNKFTLPNLLPTRALNWYGKLIKKDGSFSTVSLLPKNISKENVNMSVVLSANGDIEGKCRTTYADYDAYIFRNSEGSKTEEEYLEKLENKNEGMEISDYVVKNKAAIGKPIMESFTFNLDAQADVIGDKIYFSPLFHLAMDENPFKLEERNFPIDFTYPWQERRVLNIILPEGYEVTSMPKDINIALVDNQGKFKYQILNNGKSLQVMVDLKINEAVIGSTQYPDLKELFKNVVEKQTEKVVLSKITSNGTSESAEDRR
ncbi:MAG: DUF3857 domain-containing protein [Maribacter sp.]